MWGNSKVRANLIQGGLLLGAFLIASKDVDRTMRQSPVTEEQNRELFQRVESARGR